MIDDPVTFEVLKNALVSVAREMSVALRKTAFSPNIKERRDCSCALFDSDGRLIAQSKDIPVHLGAMPLSVKSCIEEVGDDLGEGTMALLNDPFSGGSHLPDLTLVAPVHDGSDRVAFVANRAHHADVGGESPGSMPGLSVSIEEEGVRITPRIIVRKSKLDTKSISDLLSETRTPDERVGDLSAQIAANIVGISRFQSVASENGWNTLTRTFRELIDYSEEMIAGRLSKFKGLQSEFTDYMDSDGAGNWDVPISARISIEDRIASIDFTGTADQVNGNINCPVASTLSSVYYVFLVLFGKDIPTNEGCWNILNVNVPSGSLLNPKYPAAVSAGNVETSQRIVDVILGAMAPIAPDMVPAASQGTMNNIAIGGIDNRTMSPFSFYETIGGGAGGMAGAHGTNGIHTHMTNTLNTPIESLEISYPLRVWRYSLRDGSGGSGRWRGGDGIIREIELISDACTVSIQSERRHNRAWGLQGGEPGVSGRNTLMYADRIHELQAKSTVRAPKRAIIRIETPGGGG
ncbi:MAG: hydantoinase B/oxoprolinase family protein, partial [Candidatus Thorarchaeota archaeon]